MILINIHYLQHAQAKRIRLLNDSGFSLYTMIPLPSGRMITYKLPKVLPFGEDRCRYSASNILQIGIYYNTSLGEDEHIIVYQLAKLVEQFFFTTKLNLTSKTSAVEVAGPIPFLNMCWWIRFHTAIFGVSNYYGVNSDFADARTKFGNRFRVQVISCAEGYSFLSLYCLQTEHQVELQSYEVYYIYLTFIYFLGNLLS